MAVKTEGDSVCEKQLSGAAPAIHLTSDQARREWRYFFTFCILFIHSLTHAHTYAHTFKYAQSRPRWLLAFLSQFHLVLICGMLFSLNLLKRSQSHSQPQSAEE